MIDTILGRAAAAGTSLKVLARAGIIRPYSPLTLGPDRQVAVGSGAPARPAGSSRWRRAAPDQVGLVDELGSLTFGEMHQRSNALAHALAERGVERGRLGGADVPQPPRLRRRHDRGRRSSAPTCSTSTPPSPGPQLVDVLEREEPTVVIHDEEFTDLLAEAYVESRLVAFDAAALFLPSSSFRLLLLGVKDLERKPTNSSSISKARSRVTLFSAP